MKNEFKDTRIHSSHAGLIVVKNDQLQKSGSKYKYQIPNTKCQNFDSSSPKQLNVYSLITPYIIHMEKQHEPSCQIKTIQITCCAQPFLWVHILAIEKIFTNSI